MAALEAWQWAGPALMPYHTWMDSRTVFSSSVSVSGRTWC